MRPTDAPVHVDELDGDAWTGGELNAVRTRLGAPAGATRIGVAIIDVAPGGRATPAHSHADEDELFLVLEGGGLSWQSSGSRDVRTYEITVGDVLFHPSGGDAHTLIAGDRGLRVLVVAEGSRTNITWLPRTKQFWLGPRWTPADGPPPYKAEAALPPIERPEPTAERPPTIVAMADVPLEEGARGRFRNATRDAGKAAGARRIVLAHDRLPAGSANGPTHWHTQAEEAFYVGAGSGWAVIGDERHPLRPGSFFVRPPSSGVGHRIEVGDDGMDLITMGDRVPGDVCVYPDSRKIAVRPGVFLPISNLTYFDGEPDAEGDGPAPAD